MPILESITEPGRLVEFDVEAHTYTDCVTGAKLTSGTTWCKPFKAPFDSDEIARKCSRDYGWGETPETIAAMWSENGTIAANFGTALHEVLEYWVKHKAMGARIQRRKRKDRNPAYPNHPFLYRLLKDFDAMDPTPKAHIVPEAFISYRNFCGQIDRLAVLDTKKKVARIQDYKFNADATKLNKQEYLSRFAHLPTNKVSGYQMQMSFYAHLMVHCGWTIPGLDALIYDSRWRHVALDVLDLQTGETK